MTKDTFFLALLAFCLVGYKFSKMAENPIVGKREFSLKKQSKTEGGLYALKFVVTPRMRAFVGVKGCYLQIS
jgi:hypothetical protein